ncbi:unnamed protein product [Thlaspi arvense]|uniref:Secreted protein n=1 Tax=Thlaspi arvense TaxID=13288 RepID=A0AAU9RHY2_THLAR|nr:unnamed protein product [Thlaspi arvense]
MPLLIFSPMRDFGFAFSFPWVLLLKIWLPLAFSGSEVPVWFNHKASGPVKASWDANVEASSAAGEFRRGKAKKHFKMET